MAQPDHAAFVDLTLASPLCLTSRRLLNLLVLQSQGASPKARSHSLQFNLLEAILGAGDARSALRTLADTVLSWTETPRSGSGGEVAWGRAPLLAFSGVTAGRFSYAFSPVFVQLIAHPPGRARVQSAIQKHLCTGHTLALYELCAPWSNRGRTPWWPVEQVRAALGLSGSAYYEEFKHFNAKVLKPATQELAETSDLQITPRTRRQGRAVAQLRFDVRLRPAFTLCDVPAIKDAGLVRALGGLGLSEALGRAWVAQIGPEQVRPALAATRSDPQKVPDRASRLAVIHQITSARSDREREADRRAFLETLSDSVARSDFERFAWMSARNSAEIFRFWEERAPEAFTSLL